MVGGESHLWKIITKIRGKYIMGALNWRHINLKIYDSNENLVAELNTQNGVLFENNVEAIADEAKRAGYKTKIRVVDDLPWGL